MQLPRLAGAIMLLSAASFAGAITQPAPARGFRPVPFHPTFHDYPAFYAFVTEARGLGAADDDELARHMASESSVVHWRDDQAEPIIVVRVELLSRDGTSRMRSGSGDYPWYVLRDTSRGLVLLGTMFGRTCESTLVAGKRQFGLDLHPAAGQTVQMRFRVDGDTLINLTPRSQPFGGVIA
jgi:hypothetical protein